MSNGDIVLETYHADLGGDYVDFGSIEDTPSFGVTVTTSASIKKENQENRETLEEIMKETPDFKPTAEDKRDVPEAPGIYELRKDDYRVVVDVPELTEDITRAKVNELAKHIGRKITIRD